MQKTNTALTTCFYSFFPPQNDNFAHYASLILRNVFEKLIFAYLDVLAEPSSLDSPSLCLQGRCLAEHWPICYLLLFFLFYFHLCCSHSCRLQDEPTSPRGCQILSWLLRFAQSSWWGSGARAEGNRGFRGNKSITTPGRGEDLPCSDKREGTGRLWNHYCIREGLKETKLSFCVCIKTSTREEKQGDCVCIPLAEHSECISIMRICPLYTCKKSLSSCSK